MTADQYLHGILLREAVDAGPNSPLLGVQATLMPTLRQWAGDNLLGVYPSGSFVKGTAVLSGTDIDLFLSWGGVRKKQRGRQLDGRTYDEMPVIRVSDNDSFSLPAAI